MADANQRAVALMQELGDEWRDRLPEVTVVGMVGPRGDGYVAADGVDPDEAADYHAAQLASFAEAGVDQAAVLTMTEPGEAIGVSRAAASVGLPVSVGFTVETDGRLPDGTTLQRCRRPGRRRRSAGLVHGQLRASRARAPGGRRRG